jgi:hypothetical protein
LKLETSKNARFEEPGWDPSITVILGARGEVGPQNVFPSLKTLERRVFWTKNMKVVVSETRQSGGSQAVATVAQMPRALRLWLRRRTCLVDVVTYLM